MAHPLAQLQQRARVDPSEEVKDCQALHDEKLRKADARLAGRGRGKGRGRGRGRANKVETEKALKEPEIIPEAGLDDLRRARDGLEPLEEDVGLLEKLQKKTIK